MKSQAPSEHALARWLLLASCTIAVALAGCGVSAEGRPNPLDPAEVPFGLLHDGPTASQPEQGETPFTVYLLDSEGRLVPALRTLPERKGPNHALRRLLAGPTVVEAEIGLSTAIPPGTEARATVISGDLVVVELAGSLVEASQADAVAAVAQLVFTVTEPEGVGRVLFRVDGEAVEIPRGDGTLTDEPVARTDYATLES